MTLYFYFFYILGHSPLKTVCENDIILTTMVDASVGHGDVLAILAIDSALS